MVPIGLRISSLNKHHHPAAQGAICVTFFFRTSATRPNPRGTCDSSSAGRASASQAEGHGFESRLSLNIKIDYYDNNY